jgi:Zn-finger nucleic acid-binding protein
MKLNPDRGAWDCPYCASEWSPQTNFEGVRVLQPSGYDCPVCKTTKPAHTKLAQASIFDYALLYCEECRGMLIQMADLVPLTGDMRASSGVAAHIGRPPDPRELDRRIDCPRCGRTMDTHPYCGPGNVILDTCEPCEVHWLDHGKLRRIALAPDHQYMA